MCEHISKEHLFTSHSDVRIYLAVIIILRRYEFQIKLCNVFERKNANPGKNPSYWNNVT